MSLQLCRPATAHCGSHAFTPRPSVSARAVSSGLRNVHLRTLNVISHDLINATGHVRLQIRVDSPAVLRG